MGHANTLGMPGLYAKDGMYHFSNTQNGKRTRISLEIPVGLTAKDRKDNLERAKERAAQIKHGVLVEKFQKDEKARAASKTPAMTFGQFCRTIYKPGYCATHKGKNEWGQI